MIIFETHEWQTSSESADMNYLEGVDCEQPKWVVPDSSEVAAKVMSTAYWEAVEDKDGNLIDIKEILYQPSAVEQIDEIKSYLSHLDSESIRPLRAILAGTAEDTDYEMLDIIEEQADIARMQISELEKGDE